MFVGMSRIPEGFFHIINYIFFKRYYTYLSGPKDHRKKCETELGTALETTELTA